MVLYKFSDLSKTSLIKERSYAYDLSYHLAWYTKKKDKLINAAIASALERKIFEIAQDNEYKISYLLIENNFIYLLVSAKPKASVTEIIKKLKGITGKWLLQKYAEGMEDSQIKHIWDPYYFSVSADNEVTEQVIRQQIQRIKDFK